MAGLRGGAGTPRVFSLEDLKPSTRPLGFAFTVTHKGSTGVYTSQNRVEETNADQDVSVGSRPPSPVFRGRGD